MTDQDTIELRRMVERDPAHAAPPDLPALIRSGRRIRARRRLLGAGAALGVAAVVAVPMLTLAGGPAGTPVADVARDTASASATRPGPASATADEPECGVLSCVDPDDDMVETGTVVDELSIDTLPDGAEEILYVARTEGEGEQKGRTVEVIMAGYRYQGRVYRTAWALQPGADDPEASGGDRTDRPGLWINPGPVNSPDCTGDHYVLLGYVDGSPEQITWSTPDGGTGEVGGLLRLDGYTAFYLTQPMPVGCVPALSATRNPDGSITVQTEQGPKTFHSGDVVTIPRKELMGTDPGLPPGLTIHTSDGWSCTIQKCGSSG
ncbi:hypothetical protein [Nocardioides sp.]|uniref:hypothetical protein n=1 Tax=Nocardioides sp. TaxID=35761 RepID=UPI0039E5CD8B